jgi:drug/metabolite transporter (DMT)-like permease
MDTQVAEIAPAKPRQARMLLFVFLLALANLIWAGQLTVVKCVTLGPWAIAFLPFFIITPLLLPLLWWNLRKPGAVKPTLNDWGRFAIAGIAGQVVCQLGMTSGSVIGQASSCSILYLLIPVLTAVFASALLRERITPLRIVCLGIGLAGVLMMSKKDISDIIQGGTSKLFESKILLGNLVFLGGCLGASFYNVYCKGLMQKFHERDILIYSYLTACPAALVFLLWKEPDCFARLAHLDWRGWLGLAFLALLVYGISMLMFFYVLKFLPATVALASTYLTPVFGVIIAMLTLGEHLTTYTAIGAAVVLVATVLIMRYDPSAA